MIKTVIKIKSGPVNDKQVEIQEIENWLVQTLGNKTPAGSSSALGRKQWSVRVSPYMHTVDVFTRTPAQAIMVALRWL